MEKRTILIIEPDTSFGESLKLLMDYSYEFEVTGVFEKMKEAIGVKKIPDIILIEVNDKNDPTKLKNHFPGVPFVVITNSETDQAFVDTLSMGASYCIFKGSEPAVYLSILNNVLENAVTIPDKVVKKMLLSTNASVATLNENEQLTTREKEILQLLAKGATYKNISAQLFISLETVKRHCHNIYKKLGVSNRTEAINMVLTRKII